jgi:hypothetical protein
VPRLAADNFDIAADSGLGIEATAPKTRAKANFSWHSPASLPPDKDYSIFFPKKEKIIVSVCT